MNPRQVANKEILQKLSNIVDKYPDLRFEQIMIGLGLEWMSFDEESVETLNIMNDHLSRFSND